MINEKVDSKFDEIINTIDNIKPPNMLVDGTKPRNNSIRTSIDATSSIHSYNNIEDNQEK